MKNHISHLLSLAFLLTTTFFLSSCSPDKPGDLGQAEYRIDNQTAHPIRIEALKDGLAPDLETTEIAPGESATIMTVTADNLDEWTPSFGYDQLNIKQVVDGEEVPLLDDVKDADWKKAFAGVNTIRFTMVVND